MRFTIESSTTLRVALAALCASGAVQLLGCSTQLPDEATSPATSTHPEDAIDPSNRAVLVRGGTFVAGSDDWDDEFPVGSPYSKVDEDTHRWTVESFWMQEHEVTNGEYLRFDAGHVFPVGLERHPAVDLTWQEAMAYAVSLGGSLPTEVQWEFAARGSERREYPWGDEAPTCAMAHYVECDPRSTIEVVTRPSDATPEGIHDLAGNVREWVMPVWFKREKHPVNHDALKLKGGSFAHPAFFLRSASVTNDFTTDYSWNNIGFRVVWAPRESPD